MNVDELTAVVGPILMSALAVLIFLDGGEGNQARTWAGFAVMTVAASLLIARLIAMMLDRGIRRAADRER